MTRIRRTRSLAVVATAALALAGAVVVVSPAAAWTDPVALTVTPVDAGEASKLIFGGECPTGSTQATVGWTDPRTSTPLTTAPYALDGTGEFTTSPDTYTSGGGRGETVVFTITCLDAGNAVVGSTGTASFSYPDLGSRWLNVPAVVPLGSDLTGSYDCGAVGGAWSFTSAIVRVFDASSNQLAVRAGLPVPTGSATFTPAELAGVADGDVLTLTLQCVGSDGGSPALLSAREVTTAVGPASTGGTGSTGGSAGGGTSSGPSQRTLAETGAEQALRTGLLALALLIAGGVLLVRRGPASR